MTPEQLLEDVASAIAAAPPDYRLEARAALRVALEAAAEVAKETRGESGVDSLGQAWLTRPTPGDIADRILSLIPKETT